MSPSNHDETVKPGKSAQRTMDETAEMLLKTIRELVDELHPSFTDHPLTMDTTLDRNLGLDSLARVELLARIEKRFGITLSERALIDADTPRDLLRSILGADSARTMAPIAEMMTVEMGRAEAAPSSAQTLVEALLWHVKAHPERPHIRFYEDEGEGDCLTYRRLFEGAAAVAAGLQQGGLQKGEPVVIMLPTSAGYFYTFFGILLAGGIPVSIYPPVRRSQIEEHLRRHQHILKNCGAATLVTIEAAKAFARLLKTLVDTLAHVVTPDELQQMGGVLQQPVIGAQDIAFLQYTSGSTGNPKGVVLTHANLMANIRAMGTAVAADANDVFVSWLPLYHDMGLIGAWLGSLYYATLLVIMSPLDFLARPQRWLWAVHRYRGTLSAAPNFAYEICLHRLKDEDLKGLDLTSWRVALNGAEAVSPYSLRQFCERFEPYGFQCQSLMPAYGLAECAVGLTFPPPGRKPLVDRIRREPFMRDGQAVSADEADEHALCFAACGYPLSGHEIRVVDSSGRELPERREGRLQFRGPSACGGYFHEPRKTRELFDGEWLNSGDLAYIAGGEVYITGRTKDIIIRAGRNIYPQELEEAVGNIDGIREGNVVVFGSSDPLSGTERLIVMAETGQEDSAVLNRLRQEINALATDLVGTPPDEVLLVPPLTVLKTSSGKIRRAASRDLYEKGRIGKKQAAAWLQFIHLGIAGLRPSLRRAWRNLFAGFYAVYAWSLFGLLAPLAWMAVLLVPGFSQRWKLLHHLGRLLAWGTRTTLDVRGLRNLPKKRPCVIVSNHASYLDSLVLVASLPCSVSFVAKAELKTRFGVNFFLKRLKTVYVERFDMQRSIEDARRIASLVQSGVSLLYFPEGTFTRVPGLLPFRMGAFLAATEAGVPVVPVAIRGTRSMLRADSWFPRRGAVSITIGEAAEPEAMIAAKEEDVWQRALALREKSREVILRYCGEPDLAHEKSPI